MHKTKIYHVLALLLFSADAYSKEDVVVQAIKSDPISSGYLLQLFVGLFIVVLCIIVLAWMAKKMNRFQSSSDASLKILGALSLGTREKIVLLQIGDEQLVVGVSPGRLNTLHVLKTPIEMSNKNSDASVSNGFADKLKTMISDVNKATSKKAE